MKKIIWAFFITVNLIVVLFSFAYAADTEIVTVSATVLSKNNCKFNSATAALAFGTLESANPVNKTVSTTITFRCAGKDLNATFFISDDDGLHETGPNANRMRHATSLTEYIPYLFFTHCKTMHSFQMNQTIPSVYIHLTPLLWR